MAECTGVNDAWSARLTLQGKIAAAGRTLQQAQPRIHGSTLHTQEYAVLDSRQQTLSVPDNTYGMAAAV